MIPWLMNWIIFWIESAEFFWIEWYFELNLGQSNIESNIEWINFWQNSNIELNQIGYRQPLITIQSNDLIDRILPKVSRWRPRPCQALHRLARWEVGSQEARSPARNPWTRSHSPSFWDQLSCDTFDSFDDLMPWHPIHYILAQRLNCLVIPHICHEPHEYIRVNFFGQCKFLQI